MKTKLKLKKRWLCLVMCLFCFATAVMYTVASGTPTLKLSVLDAKTPASGSTPAIVERSNGSDKKRITYEINYENDKSFNAMTFKVKYDPAALKLVDYDFEPEENKFKEQKTLKTLDIPGDEDGDGVADDGVDRGYVALAVLYSNFYKDSNVKIGSLTFEVLETASGNTEVSIEELNVQNAQFDASGNIISTDAKVETNSMPVTVFVEVPVDPTSVNVATTDLNIDMGVSPNANIVVDYLPKDTTDSKEFTYVVTEGSDVISVDNNGKVTALKVGDAKVKVTAFGKDFEVSVHVVSHLGGVKITNTEIQNKTWVVNKNDTTSLTLNYQNTPATMTDTVTTTWSSNHDDIASVDNSGNVTIKKTGKAVITVTSRSAETGKSFQDQVTLDVQAPVKQVRITDTDFTLEKTGSNTQRQLAYTIDPTDTTDKITWSSDNTSVATVSTSGLVKAVGGGEANITLTVGSMHASVKVTVLVPVTGINLDVAANSTITLLPTQVKTMKATVLPSDANDKTITWTTGNSAIATVDASGKITAIAPGETTVTATSGSIHVTRNIKVLTAVDGIVINEAAPTLDANVHETLQLTANPTNNAEETGTITWSSSNTSVATVNGNGLVTAVSSSDAVAGKANITATWTSNVDASRKMTSSIEVTVVAPIQKVTFDKTTINLVNKGSKETIRASIEPNMTSDSKMITWSSSDINVATVSNGVVTAVGKGDCVITGTTSNGKVATSKVHVTIPATGITLNTNQLNLQTLNGNTTAQLTATVEPAGSSDSVQWSSSDTNVAIVDNNGFVTAIGEGTAIITAKAGNVSKQVRVQVIVPVTSFDLVSKNKIEILRHGQSTIVTKINPSNATDQKITWRSDDEDVAVVSEDGIVSGIGEGTATITGSLSNGMKVEVSVEVSIIPVTAIDMEVKEFELNRKEKQALELIFDPENTTEYDRVVFESSDEDVATVDAYGVVTAVGEGVATITARINDLEVSVEVTVHEIHLESISITNTKKNINVGEQTKLYVLLNPTDVTDDLVYQYKSSDESIATIDENGVITGIRAGKVTFTVNVNGMEITYDFEVSKPVNPKTGIAPVTGSILVAISSMIGLGFLLRKKAKLK